MQHAGSFRSVEIDLVGFGNHAELGKIEVGVSTLQGIVGPGHLPDAHGHGPLALRLLQSRAQIQMSIGIEHGQHMRVNRRLSVLAAEESEGEPDQLIFIFLLVEGSDENIADSFAGNGQREGQGVLVRHAPDFFLDRF